MKILYFSGFPGIDFDKMYHFDTLIKVQIQWGFSLLGATVKKLSYFFSLLYFAVLGTSTALAMDDGHEFVEKTLFPGSRRIIFYDATQKPKKKLGVLSISKASYLKALQEVPKDIAKNIPGFLEIVSLVGVLTTKKYDFEKTSMLGDLYIFPALRGKGYAKILVEKACKKELESGVDNIVLIPQPFEYIDDKQVILYDELNYQREVEKLMKLYGKCGFRKIDSEQNFMVLSKKQPDPITTIKS